MENSIKKMLSIVLTASLIAVMALPAAAASGQAKVTENAAVSEKGSADDYMYGVVDMNYADFYYGELENVEPDGRTDVADVAEDPVTAAGYREDGMYDAATFATPAAFDFKAKWDGWPGTYSEPIVDADGIVQGGKILGVAEVNVAISRKLYENALKDSSASVLQAKIAEIDFNEDQSVIPESYKVLNSNGVYSKYVNVTEPTTSELTGSVHTDYMGEDNWWEGNGMSINSEQTILGGFVEWTADPADADSPRYMAGLKHEENIWTTRWIGWGVGPNAQGIYGGNEVGWKRFEGISGKYVTKLIFILQNEDGSVTYHTGVSEAGMISPWLPNGVIDENGNHPYDVKIVSHKYTRDRLILDISYDMPVMENGEPEAECNIYRFSLPSVTNGSLSIPSDNTDVVPVYEESEWVNGHKDIHIEISRDYIGTGRLKFWTRTSNVQEGGRQFGMVARWYNLTTGLTSDDIYIKNNRLYVDSSLFDVNDYRLNTYQKIIIKDSEGDESTFETGDANTNNRILSAVIDKYGNFNMDAVYTYTTGRGENKVEHNDPIFPKGSSVSYEVTIWSGGFPIIKGELNFRDNQEITVSNDSYSVNYGDKAFNLGAKTSGDSDLSYKSSDEKVATVSADGTVTIQGAGTAVITVLAEKTAKYNAAAKEISVQVAKAKQKITAKNVSKTYGDKAFSLGAKTSGDGTLNYKSGNTKIATVDKNGKVTLKGAGTVKITVTAAATANYEKASATVTVTVAKAKQTITAKNVSKTYGDKAFSLGVKTSGNGTLTYKSSNTKVATVDKNGKVTLKGPGVAKITVTAAATDNYLKASKTVTLKVAPKTVVVSSLTSSKAKTAVVTWKKNSTVTGYKIEYSTSRKFTSAKTVTVSKAATVKTTISKLTSGKTYYVRIRAYKTSGSTTVYGAYSSVKQIKVK